MKPRSPKTPTSRFVITFSSPEAKRRHVELMTETNKVGPSAVLIGGLKS